MSYSDLYTESRYRPSHMLMGLAFLAVLSGVAFYFFSNTSITRASKQVLKQHEIVNVSPQQTGVFWEVAEPDNGWIIYGESPQSLSQIALDERDIKNGKTVRKYHYAVLKNLKPDTKYFYKIISNEELISAQNNDAFTMQTISSTLAGSSLSPAYGKVISDGGALVKDAFIVLKVQNAHPLLAITGDTGEWLIPMQYMIRKGAVDRVPVDEQTIATIHIFNDTHTSQVKTLIKNTHPLPQSIIVGKNYSFMNGENVLAAQTKKTTKSTTTSSSENEITILYPKQRAVIPASKPLIKGKAIPAKTVSITINTTPQISQNIRVDSKGDWNLSLIRPIAPGSYTLTMKTLNERGRELILERSFTILKSGERVLGETTSTPSGTITVSPTSALTTPTPTLMASEPTPTDILEYDTTPTPTPPQPVSGISMIPYMMGAIALVLVGAGLVLFL